MEGRARGARRHRKPGAAWPSNRCATPTGFRSTPTSAAGATAPTRPRDLTQAFFADLLGRNFLEAIDQSKGRFRSFLLASLEHFLSHERDKASALKKGGGAQPLSLDAADAETRYRLEPADPVTPELVFERRWGLTVMERTMERLRADYDDQPEPLRAA